MATNYLDFLTSHYPATEAAGSDLIDSVGSANWTDVGTVGSVSDGPLTKARGPCGGAGGASPGFTLVNTNGGEWDISGPTSCTFLGWFRLDTVTTEDNIFIEAVHTINGDVFIFRVHHRTSPPGANPSTTAIFASDDGSGYPNFALAPGSPFRTTVVSSVWQLAGWSYDASIDELRCFHVDETGTEHYGTDTGHPAWGYGTTTTMGLGKSNIGTEGNSGLRGDLAHIDWYNGFAFAQSDFQFFYNAGTPVTFPGGYGAAGVPGAAEILRRGAGRRRKKEGNLLGYHKRTQLLRGF